MATSPFFLLPDLDKDYEQQAKDFLTAPIDYSTFSDEDHQEIDQLFFDMYDQYD
jgi:hypothetical protein